MASSMELTSSSMEGTRPVSNLLCICGSARRSVDVSGGVILGIPLTLSISSYGSDQV